MLCAVCWALTISAQRDSAWPSLVRDSGCGSGMHAVGRGRRGGPVVHRGGGTGCQYERGGAGNGEWTIKHASDRCRSVLGIEDLSASVIGWGFWQVFASRSGAGAVASAVARHRGFDADMRVFSDSGRKHWLTAAFRCGGASRLDGECPDIGIPMDVPNEPGMHSGTWFVTLRPMDQPPVGLPKELQPVAPPAAAVSPAAMSILEHLPLHSALSPEQVQVRRTPAPRQRPLVSWCRSATPLSRCNPNRICAHEKCDRA